MLLLPANAGGVLDVLVAALLPRLLRAERRRLSARIWASGEGGQTSCQRDKRHTADERAREKCAQHRQARWEVVCDQGRDGRMGWVWVWVRFEG